MKVLENKETSIKNPVIEGETPTNVKYSSLIKIAVNGNMPQGGITPSEMLSRMRIIKAVEEAESKNDNITFEDNDAEKLKSIIKDSKWAIIHEDIISLQDDIIGMKSEKS